MNDVNLKLIELGLKLPEIPNPVAAYVNAKQVGNLIYTSGQLPIIKGELISRGLLGKDVNIDEGIAAAKVCILNALAVIESIVGDLNQIRQVVKLSGYVASDPTFTQQPLVVNGASELLINIFGEKGKHARVAVGAAALPLNAPVEIELFVEIQN